MCGNPVHSFRGMLLRCRRVSCSERLLQRTDFMIMVIGACPSCTEFPNLFYSPPLASSGIMYTGWGKKLDHFLKFITLLYDDAERRSIHQNVQFFIRTKLKTGILAVCTFKYSLPTFREYYTENAN